MCDEGPPILLGNSTDAFRKWRSGEPSLLPLSSFLPLLPHFTLLFPHSSVIFCLSVSASSGSLPTLSFAVFSFLFFAAVSLCLSEFLSQLTLSLFFLRIPLSSLSLLLTAALSLFFLIRVAHHHCTHCANVTTQSDITDNNKLFPKIPSGTLVLRLQSPIRSPACGHSVCDFFSPVYVRMCLRIQLLPLNRDSSQFTGQKKKPLQLLQL